MSSINAFISFSFIKRGRRVMNHRLVVFFFTRRGERKLVSDDSFLDWFKKSSILSQNNVSAAV